MRADEGANRLVRDERDLARDARRQRVVHDLDVEALQIGDVAGDMEEDLPLSAGQDLVAAREAFDDDAALRRPVLLAHDVLVRLEVPHRHRKPEDRLPLGFRDGRDALQLADERV